MTSQTRQQIITMYTLPNISVSKGNQTMKVCQLIEYKMRNMTHRKCGGEASPRPFYEKSKFSISLDQQLEIFWSLFLLYAQVEVYQNI